MQVRIVRLGPLRVAWARVISPSPEDDSWARLIAWARSRGLLDPGRQRFFGFHNPAPTPSSPVYGYEVWATVDPEVRPDGDIRIKGFGGGLYAVTHCPAGDPHEVVPRTWKELHEWAVSSGHQQGQHQWLEEHLGDLEHIADEGAMTSGRVTLDLYYPLAG